MKAERVLTSVVLGLGLTVALVWLLTGGRVLPVHATNYTVTNTSDSGAGSLRQAILDANGSPGHDAIDFDGSVSGEITLASALPAITDDLTITGPGAAVLAVSGNDAYRVFEVASGTAVTITRLTVRNGNLSDGKGGGIWSAGTLRLENVAIVDNRAGGLYPNGRGGGVCIASGSATLSGTQVVSNSAYYGGGIYVDEGSATLIETEVVSNSAYDGGGGSGVYVDDASATLTMTGGRIESNHLSVGSGGGLNVDDGSATLNGTKIISNAAASGGGVYVYDGSVTLSGTQVVSNAASTSSGGGVYVRGGSATLVNTEVVSNAADKDGGGVYVHSGSATLSMRGGRIVGNSTCDSGGGLFVADGSATVTGTRVISNSASGDCSSSNSGGGVWIGGGSATLIETVVAGNWTSSVWARGGGIHVDQSSARLRMLGGRIDTNVTTGTYASGGGLYVDVGSATLSGTLVISNCASQAGGGVYVDEGSVTLTGAQVVSNAAEDSGGGVHVAFGSARLSEVELLNNTADDNGGGLSIYKGRATLSGTHMTNNSASGQGGGLFLQHSDGAITATNGCVVYNSDTAVHNCGAGTLNAADNWWGAPDGPSGVAAGSGDSISANVIYTGFKTSAPVGCPSYRPRVTITKTVTPATGVAWHGMVTYTVSLRNRGALSDTNVAFTDTLPGGVDFAAWVVSPTNTSLTSGEVTWSGAITAGEAVTWTWTMTHTGGYGDVVTNTGAFSGTRQTGEADAVFTTQACGSTITVQNANDSGAGSLRAAVADVCAGGTVDFATGLSGQTIGLTSQLVVDKGLTIAGNVPISVSGQGNTRVLRITDGVTVTITGLTVRDGNAASGNGGGIWSAGSLRLVAVSIMHNSASGASPNGRGGGVYVDSGSATLSGTKVFSNSASSYGGGMCAWQDSATLDVSEGEIRHNSAPWGGGVFVGAGRATLKGTDVVSNSATSYGGGLFISEGSATLTSTQVVSNSAGSHGGGVAVQKGRATLTRTHVLANRAPDGGGLYGLTNLATISANNGCIAYNDDRAVDNGSFGTVNARDTWWGAADGPSGAGPGSGDSVGANVDYASFKTSAPPGCPTYVPDLAIEKTVVPSIAAPGDAITYTLAFSGTDKGLGTGVVVTNVVPLSVTKGSLGYASSGAAITATGSISYVWQVEDLSMGEWGVITVTGVLSGSLSTGPFTNTAAIGSGAESAAGNNAAAAALCVTLRQDMDRDCDVDTADIMQVIFRWRCSSGDAGYGPRYDLDGDGVITVIDIMLVVGQWGWSCP
jgi:uncharacterized repeat protein (TIGR01451 family)